MEVNSNSRPIGHTATTLTTTPPRPAILELDRDVWTPLKLLMTMEMRKNMDHAGVNRMILALLLCALFGHVVSDYEPLNTRYLEAELREEIREAIADGDYFYIGAAGARGTPIQSLCYHQGDTTTKPYADECNRSSRHPADGRANRLRLKLDNVYYANRLDSKDVVCDIEQRLIEEYSEHPLCLNEEPGQSDCIKEKEGIVYLRVYDD